MKKRAISFILVLAVLVMALGLSITASAEGEKPTIKMLLSSKSFDMNTDYVAELLKEKTGFNVEYEYMPTENADQMLALEVASGTEYDVISTISPAMYQTLLTQGALMNLDSLLAEQPSVVENIAQLGWTYCTAKDGSIYGIPNVDDAVYVGGIGYRTDIFAEYGFEEPNTANEFYELLVAIKEKTGLIPLTGNKAFEEVIASAFGLSYEYVVDADDGKIISYLRQDGMKDYLTFMNKLYEEGLIDVDWPVNTSSAIDEKMSSGDAVMTYAAHWSTLNWVNALVENGNADAYFKSIVPLEDSDGKRHIAVSNGVSGVTVIPVTSTEKASAVMEMIAARLNAETYWLYNVGYEGTHYTLDEDGIPTPILPIFTEEMNRGNEYQIGRNQFQHPITWMARVHKTQVQWDTFYDANSKAAGFGFEGKPMTFAAFPEYTEYSAALTTMCNDYFIQVIAGAKPIDTFDDFVNEWEQAGGLELEEAATAWYQANPELVNAAMVSTSPYAGIFGYEIN